MSRKLFDLTLAAFAVAAFSFALSFGSLSAEAQTPSRSDTTGSSRSSSTRSMQQGATARPTTTATVPSSSATGTRSVAGSSATQTNVVRVMSENSVGTTVQRLERELRSRNMEVFARVDYAAKAQRMGTKLSPMRMLLVGNAREYASMIQAQPVLALGLPQQILVYEEAAMGETASAREAGSTSSSYTGTEGSRSGSASRSRGTVYIAYLEPTQSVARLGASSGQQEASRISQSLREAVDAAARSASEASARDDMGRSDTAGATSTGRSGVGARLGTESQSGTLGASGGSATGATGTRSRRGAGESATGNATVTTTTTTTTK